MLRLGLRRTPGACGEAPGGGGIEEEPGRTGLFRRLRGQKAEPLKLIKGENHLLAPVTYFQAT